MFMEAAILLSIPLNVLAVSETKVPKYLYLKSFIFVNAFACLKQLLQQSFKKQSVVV